VRAQRTGRLTGLSLQMSLSYPLELEFFSEAEPGKQSEARLYRLQARHALLKHPRLEGLPWNIFHSSVETSPHSRRKRLFLRPNTNKVKQVTITVCDLAAKLHRLNDH